MIHLFNRAELLITYDLTRLNQTRETLAAAGIQYIYRTKDLTNPTVFGGRRGQMGTFGIDDKARVEYKLYVHKTDFGRAKRLL